MARCLAFNAAWSRTSLINNSPSEIRLRQGLEIWPSISLDQGPQSIGRDHLDLVAPLIEMPSHLQPTCRLEPDDQASIISRLQNLRGVKAEFGRTLGGIGRETPDHLAMTPKAWAAQFSRVKPSSSTSAA